MDKTRETKWDRTCRKWWSDHYGEPRYFEPDEEGTCETCGEFGDLDRGLCEECYSDSMIADGVPFGREMGSSPCPTD